MQDEERDVCEESLTLHLFQTLLSHRIMPALRALPVGGYITRSPSPGWPFSRVHFYLLCDQVRSADQQRYSRRVNGWLIVPCASSGKFCWVGILRQGATTLFQVRAHTHPHHSATRVLVVFSWRTLSKKSPSRLRCCPWLSMAPYSMNLGLLYS